MSSSLILCNNNEPFLNQIVMWEEKWIVYDKWQWPAQWLDQEKAPKHFTKPNLHYRRGHGHYLVVCCWSDPLQLSESWGNHYLWEVCLMKVKALVDQSCLTLCDPVDCSPSGSPVCGIFQERILEWVAISFSRGSTWTRVSRIRGRNFYHLSHQGSPLVVLQSHWKVSCRHHPCCCCCC